MFFLVKIWELWINTILNPLIFYFFPLRDNDKSNPTTLGLTYPTYRDKRMRSCNSWLAGRRIEDGAENLWRVWDNLYDLNNFIERHPGGSEWLQLTKGTDITEAFETHHLDTKVQELLPKFFVRKAKTVRNSPFTFNEDGFYKTLKRKVLEVRKDLPTSPVIRSKIITDVLLMGYLSSAVASAYYESFALGLVAALLLYYTAVAAHNYLHRKDSIRMYYINFTMMSSRVWRISHAMSHHMFPNTIKDLEISEIEPWLQYLTTKKNFWVRYVSWLYSPIFYSLLYFMVFVRETSEIIHYKQSFRKSRLLPFAVPILMYSFSEASLLKVACMFAWIILTSSLYFGFIGLNVGHHHPDVFHDGNISKSPKIDWGIYQLSTTAERKLTMSSHFMVLTHFGDHTLHHLFPTIDHGLLQYLYPVFLETCKEFDIEFQTYSMVEIIRGQYNQLAKVSLQ